MDCVYRSRERLRISHKSTHTHTHTHNPHTHTHTHTHTCTDYGQVKAWFTVANSINLEVYLDRSWDSSLTREPTSEEIEQTVQRLDLDGSTRISVEEHYFRWFADLNADGWLSKDEYYLSLYKKVGFVCVCVYVGVRMYVS